MGFLSTLGKIASIAGPIAAIPFTGGASAGLLGMSAGTTAGVLGGLGAAGEVLGKQQQGKAEGAAKEAEIQQAQDRNALASYQAEQAAQNSAGQLDLQRKQYTDDSRSANAKHAIIASLLGGGKMGGSINVPGIHTADLGGGPMAALASNPDALASLAEFGKQSNAGLSNPAAFTGGNVLKAPALTALPDVQGGGFLSTLANLGQLGGAVAPYLKTGAPPSGGAAYQVPNSKPYQHLFGG